MKTARHIISKHIKLLHKHSSICCQMHALMYEFELNKGVK